MAATTRALRGAYTVTLPGAAVLVDCAPYVLLVFGSQYSAHGSEFLRWSAASSLFYVFNYVCDVVLVAHHKVRAYILVNSVGAVHRWRSWR